MSSDSNANNTSQASAEPQVAALRASAKRLLEPQLNTAIAAMTDHMFTLSSGSNTSPDTRRQCFEAFSTLKVQGRALVAGMLAHIDGGYAKLATSGRAPKSTETPSEGHLDLIDLGEFEDKLAIDRMVKSGSDRYWVQLEAMTLRLGKVLNVPPTRIELPFGIRGLCTAYRESLKPLEFSQTLLTELDKSFSASLLPALGDTYYKLNQQLEKEGLLPGLEEEIQTDGSKLTPATTPHNTTDDGQQPTASTTMANSASASTASGAPAPERDPYLSDLPTASRSDSRQPSDISLGAMSPRPARRFITPHQRQYLPSALEQAAAKEGSADFLPGRGDQGLHTLIDAYTLDRVRAQWGDSGIAPASADTLAAQATAMANHIAALRHDGFIPANNGQPLMTQLGFDQLGAELDPVKGSVKLVNNLYETMRDTLPLSDKLATSLDSLKLPLAQLSLSEPTFYRNPDHPARQLIERITELAALAPHNNARIEKQINDILHGVNSNYDGSLETFHRALTQLTDLALAMLKQQRRSIQRQVAAEEGKEKRQRAIAKVEQDLVSALRATELPEALLALIDTLLRDALVVMMLRDDTAVAYHAVLDRLGALCQRLLEIAAGAEPLSDAAAHAELKALTSACDDGAFLTPEQDQTINRLRQQLAGAEPITKTSSTLGKLAIFAEPAFSERLKSLPRLMRWVRRARELPLNTWLTDQLAEDRKRSIQLIWRNDDGTRFAFTNEQGQKVRDLNVIELARWLGSSLRPLTPSEQLPIIERSVFTTLERRQADLASMVTPRSNTELGRGQLVDWLQSVIRRARRKGPKHSLLAVHTDAAEAVTQLVITIENAGFTVEARGLISPTTHGLVLNTVALDRLQRHIVDHPGAANAGIGLAVIDPAHGGAEDLLNTVAETAKRGLALSPNMAIVAERSRQPTDLGVAVRNIYERLLADMPPSLSLRRVHRSGCIDPDEQEQVYQVLLDSAADTVIELSRAPGYHSSALTIALDCLKVKAVCEFAEQIATAGCEVPAFSIRLSTDAALHHDFLEFVLTQVSNSGIGTDRLCIELRDSSWLREESRIADFARTLRSIGCHIAISGVNPSRGTTSQLQQLRPHMLALDTSLWPPDATRERLPALHQAISDLHHLVGERVVFRDQRERALAAELGIDFIELFDERETTPEQLLAQLPSVRR